MDSSGHYQKQMKDGHLTVLQSGVFGALCSGVCDVHSYQLIDVVGRFACFRLQGLGLVFNKQVFDNQEIQL